MQLSWVRYKGGAMAFDSSAGLLFSIGANSDDAEANIARFRSLLGKDLGDLKGEFGAWAEEILGDLTTVKGATIALTAVTAAGVVALGTAMVETTDHYADYVAEVERGSKATGISTERMSGLKFMAAETGTSYDSLVTGLTRFSSTIVKAAEGGKQQSDAFAALGITQAQIAAGEKDMMPLLDLVADRMHALGSQVDRTAIARDLFSRGGAALVRMLSLGSEGMKEFEARAAALGLTVEMQDVVAMEKYRAALAAVKSQQEALDIELGKNSISVMTELKEAWAGLWMTLKTFQPSSILSFWAQWGANVGNLKAEIEQTAKALANLPTGQGDALEHTAKAAKEMVKDFRGFNEVLDEYQGKIAEAAGGEAKVTEETRRMQEALQKARDEFEKLKSEGKLDPAEIERQTELMAAAAAKLPEAVFAAWNSYWTKQDEAVAAAGNQLRETLLRQGQQTMAVQVALLEMERNARLEKLHKEKDETAENLALVNQIYQSGLKKIEDTQAAAVSKEGRDIDAKIAEQGERTFELRRSQVSRQIDELRVQHEEKYGIEEEYEQKLDQLKKVELDKIAADEKLAGDTELARLQEDLKRVESAHETSEQRIVSGYQADLAKYVAIEERKSLALAVGEAQRAQISKAFAAIREGLLNKEQQDLQALTNSTGWRGVFGQEFAQMIRGNENLLKEWSTSTNQSAMMVKVTLEALKETAHQTFDQMAKGMGQNIAHAVIYSKSIGQAMKAVLESTLESLAAQAITYAIFSTALGFTDLAEGNEAGAAAAFTAAAIWASVGAAAAISGRALAGSGGGAGGSGAGTSGPGSYGSQTAAASADQGSAIPAPNAGGRNVQVNVYGHVVGTSGVGELCSMINDAVINGDQPLTATNTKTGVQVNR
ncbi:MAG: hypothetical protein P4L56_13250 [Candidatus Sulfopaludibacter sp.]|nr:hypothetical protein [Candidatus Sulfopaludibacter sp.]